MKPMEFSAHIRNISSPANKPSDSIEKLFVEKGKQHIQKTYYIFEIAKRINQRRCSMIKVILKQKASSKKAKVLNKRRKLQ